MYKSSSWHWKEIHWIHTLLRLLGGAECICWQVMRKFHKEMPQRTFMMLVQKAPVIEARSSLPLIFLEGERILEIWRVEWFVQSHLLYAFGKKRHAKGQWMANPLHQGNDFPQIFWHLRTLSISGQSSMWFTHSNYPQLDNSCHAEIQLEVHFKDRVGRLLRRSLAMSRQRQSGGCSWRRSAQAFGHLNAALPTSFMLVPFPDSTRLFLWMLLGPPRQSDELL